MSLFGVILVLVVVSLLASSLPALNIPPAARSVLGIIVFVVCLLFLLELLGVFAGPMLYHPIHVS